MELAKGYKQTELGVIPEDWEVKAVGDCFEIHNNLRLPLSQEVRSSMKGEYPYYGPTKIQDHINEYRVEGEYALIGEDGDHFLKYESVPMTQLAFGRFNVNNHAHLIKGREDTTLTTWFYNFFKHRDITGFLARQGAGRYKLSKGTLITLPCAIPPLMEQQAIAKVLADTDALIQTLEMKIAKKKLIKQGAMQELLKPKDGWEKKRLGNVGQISMGQSPSSVYYNKDKKGLPLIQGNADLLNRNTIVRNYTTEVTKVCEPGDIVMSVRAPVGAVAITEFRACIGRGVCSIKYRNRYLFHYLISIETKWNSYSTGSTFDSISADVLGNLIVSIPQNENEEIKISSALDLMDKEIESLNLSLKKNRIIKQALMQQLLTGKVRLI